uniref:ATP synthase complex subunit 8 n=1 Tax=Microphor holosericeus TaxID=2498633 RepID=A0A7G7CE24_9MUSC|nr:ATP synthase F0 subunit 8 [Microphor holosericeus]
MPQMAPINWLSLFMLFSLVFMLFCMMNYYSSLPSSPKMYTKENNRINSLNWKW